MSFRNGFGLPRHLWFLLIVLAAENSLAVQVPHPWFNIYLYRGLPIVFGLALIFFGRLQFRTAFLEIHAVDRRALGAHVGTLFLLGAVELFLSLHYSPVVSTTVVHALVWLWLTLFPLLIATLLLTFLSGRQLVALARSLGASWVYASVSALLVVILRERLRLAWDASSSRIGSFALESAFRQTHWLLRLFYPDVVQDPATHILGTPRFLVLIGGTCSGLEGLALMTAFAAVWLVFARRELRIGRALLLMPVALGLMWAMNVLRLVTLIAIGDAGYPEIASQGFHSEAGWIAFNLVSLAFLMSAQKIQWFRVAEVAPIHDSVGSSYTQKTNESNVAAVYLAPFLAITAASVVGQATSAGFEWLYPLRFFAALAAFWAFRRDYQRMDWRFGPWGISTGLAVAAMWLGLRALPLNAGSSAANGAATAAGLAAVATPARTIWIGLRVLAASLTVPIAEELAFRGFVARRFMSNDPTRVPFGSLNTLAILGSSAAFGFVHGRMWFGGLLAGVAFALVAKLRGRLGEAVIAHATANFAIAVVAVASHNYALW